MPPHVLAEPGRVEEYVVRSGGDHGLVLGGGDDVAGCEVGERVDSGHDATTVDVQEDGTLAAHRLRDEGRSALVPGEEENGGVELHELGVADRQSGAQGCRHPVTGTHRGVGGGRPQRSDAPGRQYDATRRNHHRISVRQSRHTAYIPIRTDDEVDETGTRQDGDPGSLQLSAEALMDLVSGSVAFGMENSTSMVAPFEVEIRLAIGPGVEVSSEAHEMTQGSRGVVDQVVDVVAVAQPSTCREGVVEMEGEGVILAPDRSQTTLRQIGGGVVYPLAGHDRHGA